MSIRDTCGNAPEVLVLGGDRLSKRTLISGLTRVATLDHDGVFLSPSDIERRQVREIRCGGPQYGDVGVDVVTPSRKLTLVFCLGSEDAVKALITAERAFTACVVMVRAADGLLPCTVEDVRLARRVGVTPVAVFVSRVDGDDRDDAIRVAEDIRVRLRDPCAADDGLPAFAGSALQALNDPPDPTSIRLLRDLLGHLDRAVPSLPELAALPFLMDFEDIFAVPSRGTVLCGRVSRGHLAVGDEIEIRGRGASDRVRVVALERYREVLQHCGPSDTVGCFVDRPPTVAHLRGQVIAAPRSVAPTARVDAELYLYDRFEGNEQALLAGQSVMLNIRGGQVRSVLRLADRDTIEPGTCAPVEIEMDEEVVVLPFERFTITREGTRGAIALAAAIAEP